MLARLSNNALMVSGEIRDSLCHFGVLFTHQRIAQDRSPWVAIRAGGYDAVLTAARGRHAALEHGTVST